MSSATASRIYFDCLQPSVVNAQHVGSYMKKTITNIKIYKTLNLKDDKKTNSYLIHFSFQSIIVEL